MSGKVIEPGAGAGRLTKKLAKDHEVTGLDFQGKPQELEADWVAGDLFSNLPEVEGETVVANLILRHFEDEALVRLGELLKGRRRLVAVEPWRRPVALAEGRLLWPLIHQVTRHDMLVSIRAGFRKGDLPEAFGLGGEWEWREDVSLLGGIRVVAWRR